MRQEPYDLGYFPFPLSSSDKCQVSTCVPQATYDLPNFAQTSLRHSLPKSLSQELSAIDLPSQIDLLGLPEGVQVKVLHSEVGPSTQYSAPTTLCKPLRIS